MKRDSVSITAIVGEVTFVSAGVFKVHLTADNGEPIDFTVETEHLLPFCPGERVTVTIEAGEE